MASHNGGEEGDVTGIGLQVWTPTLLRVICFIKNFYPTQSITVNRFHAASC